MYIPRGSNMTKAYGARDTYNSETGGRTRAGFKQGGKDLVKSYVGDAVDYHIGSKAVSAGGGAISGWKSASKAHKHAIKTASSRVAKSSLKKSTNKVLGKAAFKAGGKAVGGVGFISDGIVFAKGFKKGYSSYGN